MTKRYLDTHKIPFTEHNINEEPQYIDYLKQKGFQQVPVLEADGLDSFSGFRPDALKQLAVWSASFFYRITTQPAIIKRSESRV